jgi:RNA polymerase sigma-70 factor, ECF subfamily
MPDFAIDARMGNARPRRRCLHVGLGKIHGLERWYDGGASADDEVRAHASALRGLAMRLCRNAADAEDLVQDTLERACRRYDRLTPGSNVRSWLLSVLHHRFIDLCRRQARNPHQTPLDKQDAANAVPDVAPVWANVTEDNVRAAVAELPDDLRAAYELCVHQKRTREDIARILGIATMTVGTRLLRARRRLRDLLLRHTIDVPARSP